MYYEGLKEWSAENKVRLPVIPDYASQNGHMFYLVCNTAEQRSRLIEKLKANGILAVFHYLSLHKSKFYKNIHGNRELPNSDIYTENLVRLPLYYELTEEDQAKIINVIKMKKNAG